MPAHDADDFLDQVAPRVVLVFVVAPLFEAVVFDAVEAAGVEVQAVAGSVVAELFAVETFFGVVLKQAAVGFVLVGDFATQFVEGAAQFAGRVVFVAAMERVVGVLDIALWLYERVLDLRQFFRG
ncbi:hypothetical protein BKM06_11235 [Pseudomonas syringae pv. syringae]|nr:hypothetical protein BKM06_11235 [Pseudomonas syringae pv. syringae]